MSLSMRAMKPLPGRLRDPCPEGSTCSRRSSALASTWNSRAFSALSSRLVALGLCGHDRLPLPECHRLEPHHLNTRAVHKLPLTDTAQSTQDLSCKRLAATNQPRDTKEILCDSFLALPYAKYTCYLIHPLSHTYIPFWPFYSRKKKPTAIASSLCAV